MYKNSKTKKHVQSVQNYFLVLHMQILTSSLVAVFVVIAFAVVKS